MFSVTTTRTSVFTNFTVNNSNTTSATSPITTSVSANTTSTLTSTSETTSTTTTTTTTTTTRATSTSASSCPDLNDLTNDLTTTRRHNYLVSSAQRSAGTVVRVECPTTDLGSEAVYLLCQNSGQWNSTLPQCSESFELSSYKLFFAVGGGVVGLMVVVLSIIYCSLLKEGRKKSSRQQGSDDSESGHIKEVDPYHIGERLYLQPSSSEPNLNSSKQKVFSTHLNPTFIDDPYDRWKKQEDTDRLYDSPWPKQRGLKSQMETEHFKWSQSSLKNLSDTGFQKLPRGIVSIDRISFSSEDSSETTTKSADPLFANKSSSPGQTLHGVKRYRRMRSREFASNTLPSKPAGKWSREGDSDSSLSVGDSTIGLTNL